MIQNRTSVEDQLMIAELHLYKNRKKKKKKKKKKKIRLLGGITAKWSQIGTALTFLSNTPSLMELSGFICVFITDKIHLMICIQKKENHTNKKHFMVLDISLSPFVYSLATRGLDKYYMYQ